MRYLILLFITLPAFLNAQIYPNLTGDELLETIVEGYKPDTVPTYGPARDILFGEIDRINNFVTCVYTGHQVYLPDGVDPSTHIFQNGGPEGINTEHTYPQSMGAEFGNPKSDMHHLFPTLATANAARGSLPFKEINDNQTDEWFFQTNEQSNIPSSNINAYSEVEFNEGFEPREDHKGNVARAMFYFYTMYRSQANNANPNYFEGQRETLCAWHYADPADSREIQRTYAISDHQSGKVNPFVLDCTLASRSYCADVTELCTPSSNNAIVLPKIKVYPNPATSYLQIKLEDKVDYPLQFELYNAIGKSCGTYLINDSQTQISLNLTNGLYFYTLKNEENSILANDRLMIIN